MGRRLLLLSVLVLLAGAFVVALVSERRIEGAVPGDAPVLSLAVTGAGHFVGTNAGAFVSADAAVWRKVSSLPNSRILAASEGDVVDVVAGGIPSLLSRDGETFSRRAALPASPATAIAADGGRVLLATNHGLYLLRSEATDFEKVVAAGGPDEIVAVALDHQRIYAAGISSGLWELSAESGSWRRLLATPTRAVALFGSKKMLIGTAGGVLRSENAGLSWTFAGLREPIEALAVREGRVFALTASRLLFESEDGEVFSRPVS